MHINIFEKDIITMDYEIKTVKTSGITMKYMKFGSGDKSMVILPGLSVKSVLESADAIANQYKSMTEDFTISLFDRRENMPDRYTVEEMAEDTAKVMAEEGLSKTYLFGASQGGMMALAIAARHPESVAKLALGSTCAAFVADKHPAIGEWTELAKEHKGPELFMSFAKKLYPPAVTESLTDFLISTGKSVTDSEFERFVTCAEGTEGFDIRDEITAIRCPVLILGSEDDEVVGPEGSREIYSFVSVNCDAGIHMYEGLGHASFDTAEDYRERLTAFFL